MWFFNKLIGLDCGRRPKNLLRPIGSYACLLLCPIAPFLLHSLDLQALPPIADVSTPNDFLANYPAQIRTGSAPSESIYNRQSGYYAVHDQHQQPSRNVTEAVLQLEDGAIAVFAGTPNTTQRGIASVGPVYALQPSGAIAVPTGLIFIQFAEGTRVESQRQAIQQAGYTIAETLPYAPHAAWVRAQSGNIADSLNGVAKLAAIAPGTQVEPQLLMERTLR